MCTKSNTIRIIHQRYLRGRLLLALLRLRRGGGIRSLRAFRPRPLRPQTALLLYMAHEPGEDGHRRTGHDDPRDDDRGVAAEVRVGVEHDRPERLGPVREGRRISEV